MGPVIGLLLIDFKEEKLMLGVKKRSVGPASVGVLLLLVCVCFCSHPVGATITGDQLTVTFYYMSNPLEFRTLAVPGTGDFEGLTVTITDGSMTVQDLNPYVLGWGAGPFCGFVVTDNTKAPGFTSVSLVSLSLQSPAGADYIYPVCTVQSGDSFMVNFNPTAQINYLIDSVTPDPFTYTFSFTYGPAVPLPPSVLLLGTGLLGLAGAGFRMQWRK
jgi:hypothetical protein